MATPVALITDSTCDIPEEWRQQYDIDVVPLTIIFGEETFLDGVELPAREFYARLGTDPRHPTTSQPTSAAFLEAYHRAYQKGAERILVFTISHAMSGTYDSAQSAALESPIPVDIVDSKSNSMGLGWQVIAAARAKENGGALDTMMAAAKYVRERLAYYITLDTIEYLAKGGRIAGAARLLNSVLKIKPLIYVNHETGSVGASIPSRSRKSAIESVISEFIKKIDPARPMHVTVLHNAADEEATELAERMKREFNPVEIFISIVSPVLGVHTGPRALALCGYTE